MYSLGDIAHTPFGSAAIQVIITIPLCVIATVLRLLATKRSSRSLSWDDWFAVLALVSFLVYAFASIIGPSVVNRNDHDYAVHAAKVAYGISPFFYLNQLFARGSLLVYYYRIFRIDSRFRTCVYILAMAHIAWFLTFVLMILLLCNPVSKYWDVKGTQPGTCINGNVFLVSEESINSTLDFAMVILAAWTVKRLQMRTLFKTRLIFIFIIGGFSGVIGFIKIGIVYGTAKTNGQSRNDHGVWDLLQMAISLFCICAPMYRILLPLKDFYRRILPKMESWRKRKHEHVTKSDSSEIALT